jgi:hypothetical protein
MIHADPAEWVDVRISPPNGVLVSGVPPVCPAEFCLEPIRKNHSIETHLKKHLHLILEERNRLLSDGSVKHSCVPPHVTIKYCCNVPTCLYGYSKPEGDRFFMCLKYLKQVCTSIREQAWFRGSCFVVHKRPLYFLICSISLKCTHQRRSCVRSARRGFQLWCFWKYIRECVGNHLTALRAIPSILQWKPCRRIARGKITLTTTTSTRTY